jgi:hypothetical protein
MSFYITSKYKVLYLLYHNYREKEDHSAKYFIFAFLEVYTVHAG